MQSFWHPFEPLLLALGHGAARTYSFFLILAQHRLFFLLLIGSSSKDIRRTSVGGETFIFFLICHETQICVTNSLNRALCPKIWALYYSAEYCSRMRKRTFRWRESGLKRLYSSSLLKCWIMSSSRTLCLHLSFSLDLPNLRQGQGAWICGMPFTRVFIPPRFSSPSSSNIYCFFSHFNIKRYDQMRKNLPCNIFSRITHHMHQHLISTMLVSG